jgi:hypothetical protein
MRAAVSRVASLFGFAFQSRLPLRSRDSVLVSPPTIPILPVGTWKHSALVRAYSAGAPAYPPLLVHCTCVSPGWGSQRHATRRRAALPVVELVAVPGALARLRVFLGANLFYLFIYCHQTNSEGLGGAVKAHPSPPFGWGRLPFSVVFANIP